MSVLTHLLAIIITAPSIWAQDYAISEIVCHEVSSQGGAEILTARMRKPQGFRGHPAFADNRKIKPNTDENCKIWLEKSDPTETIYRLRITDFTKCPVHKANGYVNVKIWFPRLDGVLMMNDQDVVIMCKPPDAVVTKNRATGFTGSLQTTTRVSGTVEEQPGKLEYELSLFQETTSRSNNFELPVEGAVPIGTMLQLRAAINTNSAWRFLKLTEVTVSTDPRDPHAPGYISLVKEGCRLKEYEGIVPQQPFRADDKPSEVLLNFEAFLLENMVSASQLWLHSQIKACIEAVDCLPEFCLDLFQPSGYGRRRRRSKGFGNDTDNRFTSLPEDFPSMHDVGVGEETVSEDGRRKNWGEAASIGENIGITVIVPGVDSSFQGSSRSACASFLALTAVLACLLLFSSAVVVVLARRVSRLLDGTVAKGAGLPVGIETVYSPSYGRPPPTYSAYTNGRPSDKCTSSIHNN